MPKTHTCHHSASAQVTRITSHVVTTHGSTESGWPSAPAAASMSWTDAISIGSFTRAYRTALQVEFVQLRTTIRVEGWLGTWFMAAHKIYLGRSRCKNKTRCIHGAHVVRPPIGCYKKDRKSDSAPCRSRRCKSFSLWTSRVQSS